MVLQLPIFWVLISFGLSSGIISDPSSALWAEQYAVLPPLLPEQFHESDPPTERNYKSRTLISTMLRNPFYIGLMQIKGEVYKGKHEAIISTEIFENVALLLDGKKKC